MSDGSGNFWGTTMWGGNYGFTNFPNGLGTVFELNAVTGKVTGVIPLSGNSGPNRGANPYPTLVSDGLGYLWATTYNGGNSGQGTVFKVNPVTGILTTVIDFNNGTFRGASPGGGLFNDGSGNLWGTTTLGGNGGWGTVFKIDAATGSLTTVVDFTASTTGSASGSLPFATPMADGSGNLWGTTLSGGVHGFGTVYKVNMATGIVTTPYSFNAINGSPWGCNLYGGLVSDGAGYLWGTTYSTTDTGNNDWGTIFKINESTGVFTTVISLAENASNHGTNPNATMVNDGAGNLWGTATTGGLNVNGYSNGGSGYGTVFKLKASTGVLTTVCDFSGTSGTAPGATPYAELVSDGSGNYWGTTFSGGANGYGTVFKINQSTGVLTTVSSFLNLTASNRGSFPTAGLVSDGSGNFWGTTAAGGANGYSMGYGTIYEINAATRALTTICDFTGTSGAVLGATPNAGLASDGSGNLWGSTSAGGTNNFGTVYKVNAATGDITTVVEFNGATTGTNRGGKPLGTPITDGSGNFWGTTSAFGSKGYGTLYKFNSATGTLATVADFTGTSGTAPGATPNAGLVSDGTGNFWGVTSSGGNNNYGTVFKINVAGGNFTSVISFTGTGGAAQGNAPAATLLSDGAGNLWGTTSSGGANNYGTVFKLNAATGTLTTVADFSGASGAAQGATPNAALVSDSSGNVWGTTEFGGANNAGTVFKLNTVTGIITTVFNFTGTTGAAPGANPTAALVCDGAGNFWGATQNGGITADGNPASGGEIFMINVGPTNPSASASGITSSSAILTGTVNPNSGDTTAYFQTGTSGNYGTVVASQDIGSGATPVAITGAATGLLPGTTYHYQLVASDSNGQITTADQTFTTLAPTPYQSWQGQNFTAADLLDPTISGDQATPAGDEIANLLKYAFGLCAKTVYAPAAVMPAVAPSGGNFVFTFTENLAATDLTYTVQESPDLINWSTATDATLSVVSSNGTTEQVAATIPLKSSGGDNFRLIVSH